MTSDLRARIVAALDDCRTLIPETQADAVMAVIESDLVARGAALRRLMVAAEKLVLDWPNPGSPKNRQAANRAVDEVEVLFGDVIRAGRGIATKRESVTGGPPEDESRIAAWYAAKYFKCASCGTPEAVKPTVFRLPNGGGDLCADCAKPVIESTRAIEEFIARKKAQEAAGG